MDFFSELRVHADPQVCFIWKCYTYWFTILHFSKKQISSKTKIYIEQIPIAWFRCVIHGRRKIHIHLHFISVGGQRFPLVYARARTSHNCAQLHSDIDKKKAFFINAPLQFNAYHPQRVIIFKCRLKWLNPGWGISFTIGQFKKFGFIFHFKHV